MRSYIFVQLRASFLKRDITSLRIEERFTLDFVQRFRKLFSENREIQEDREEEKTHEECNMGLELEYNREKGIVVESERMSKIKSFRDTLEISFLPTDNTGESSKCNSLHAMLGAVRIRERYITNARMDTHVCMYVYVTHTRIDESVPIQRNTIYTYSYVYRYIYI